MFPSGPGSALQASGAQSKRSPAEDLQRDDRLDRAQDAGQKQSVPTLTASYILCVCLFSLQLSSDCSGCWLSSLSLSLSSLSLFICLSVCLTSVVLSSSLMYLTVFQLLFLLISASPSLSCLDAEVHYANMTALTKGHLLSSFWVVDRRHFYIGSASMDWRSLATVSKTTSLFTYSHIQKHLWK